MYGGYRRTSSGVEGGEGRGGEGRGNGLGGGGVSGNMVTVVLKRVEGESGRRKREDRDGGKCK